jgi:hypothetical protein
MCSLASLQQIVINGVRKVLAGAEVALRRLNGRVAEEELDLFELASRGAAELRTRTTEVVGGDVMEAGEWARRGPMRSNGPSALPEKHRVQNKVRKRKWPPARPEAIFH